jgi:lysophospholipase L1-like esterase
MPIDINHEHQSQTTRLIPTMSNPLNLVGIGSSFAAGPGLAPLSNRAAARSSVNYINLLGQSLKTDSRRVNVTDLSISGATLLTVLSEPQTMGGVEFPPQIPAIPVEADIVTLTAGGNDLMYIGGLVRNAMNETAYVGGVLSALLRWSGRLPPPSTPPSAEEVTARFTQVIDAIHARAPNARILLVTYLTCLGNHVQAGVNTQLTAAQIDRGKKTAEMLKRCYVEASRQRSDICELVDVSEESKAYAIGSDEPWMAGWSLGMMVTGETPFHPTYKGHVHIAQRLKQVIENERA